MNIVKGDRLLRQKVAFFFRIKKKNHRFASIIGVKR